MRLCVSNVGYWAVLGSCVAFSFLWACAQDLDLVGKSCPCIAAYVCNPNTNLCVAAATMPPLETTDAGSKANPKDASSKNLTDADPIPKGKPKPVCTQSTFATTPIFDASSCDDIHSESRFCSGLEKLFTPWSFIQSSGSFAQKRNDFVYRGSSAFYARTIESVGNDSVHAYARTSQNLFNTESVEELYARAYFYKPTGPLAENQVVQLNWSNMPEREIHVQLDAQGNIALISSHNSHTSIYNSEYALPLDQWTCIELHVSHADRIAEFWTRSQEDTQVQCRGQLQLNELPEIEDMRFSVGLIQSNTPTMLWVDEIVVDEKRIGCDAPMP